MKMTTAVIAAERCDYLNSITYHKQNERNFRGVHLWDTHHTNLFLKSNTDDTTKGEKVN